MKVMQDHEAQGEAEVVRPVEPIEEANTVKAAELTTQEIMAPLKDKNLEISAISLLIVKELIMKNQ
jgi:hypothetical protein